MDEERIKRLREDEDFQAMAKELQSQTSEQVDLFYSHYEHSEHEEAEEV